MARLDELRERLVELAGKELDTFRSSGRREFFIEWMQAGNLEELLVMFTPDYHNERWEAEFQRMKDNSADIDSMIKDRRAVAYMFSGKQCVAKHYGENELTLHASGIPRMNWVLNELKQLEETQKECESTWIAAESSRCQ